MINLLNPHPSVQIGLSVLTDGALHVKNQVETKKKLSRYTKEGK